MIQVFIFNVLPFWYVLILKQSWLKKKEKQNPPVGLLDNRLINKRMHTNSTSSSTYCEVSPKRAYRTPKKDAAFNQSSISLHPPPPLFLPSDHLLAEKKKYILLFFFSSFCCINGQKRNFQRIWSKTVITVYICVCVCGEYIYCHAEESCREESLSMLVQNGKPPSPSGFSSQYRMLGGPRLLGLSLDQGSYRNRH